MRRLGLIAGVAASALTLAPAQAQTPRPTCASGATLFVEHRVRILGVPFKTREDFGRNDYACAPRVRRPVAVGGDYFDRSTASRSTEAYALGGGRYVGDYTVSDGEGGPSASVTVTDLRTRRGVAFTNVAYDEDVVPRFRVAGDGTLVIDLGPVLAFRPGRREEQQLSAKGVPAGSIAMVGAKVYWTESPEGKPETARLTVLDGVGDGPEATMLEPVLTRRRAACPRARGTTVAASPTVRVAERGGSRFACRSGSSRRIPLGPAQGSVRAEGDRWVMVLADGIATVVDTRSGEAVSTADSVSEAILVRDGMLAWIDSSGGVLSRRPGAAAPTQHAPAGSAASDLAANTAGRLYWTAGGAAHATGLK